MDPTIYACFEKPVQARQVAGKLLQSGVRADDVTVIAKQPIVPPSTREGPKTEDLEFGAMPQTFRDLRTPGPGQSIGDASMADPSTRLADIAAESNASVEPGAMTEFLWRSLPVDVVDQFRQAYDGGQAILVIKNPPEDADRMLREGGATGIHRCDARATG